MLSSLAADLLHAVTELTSLLKVHVSEYFLFNDDNVTYGRTTPTPRPAPSPSVCVLAGSRCEELGPVLLVQDLC